jgi:hypothetical protein
MSLHKKGQTYKQLLRRADNTIESLKDVIKKLQHDMVTLEMINPRTGNSFSNEAEFMFRTLAIIEAELRGTDSNVLVAARESLEQLGFNIVEQYENKCLMDGAYFGKN